METTISKMIERISRYEIINNLIPGTALCFILSHLGYPILNYNAGISVVICYLVGLINSRFSSLIVEGICRKVNIVQWRKYELYIAAKAKRPFIETLQENANMYRAFVSVFFISLIAYVIQRIMPKCVFLQNNGIWILIVVLLVLFLFSYRKQVNEYVVKNIDEVKNDKESEKVNN